MTIRDTNDNTPEFVYNERQKADKSYLVTISKTTPSGTGIIQVKASDKDQGPFGKVNYGFGKGHDGYFEIDPITGVVRTTSSLVDIDEGRLPFRVSIKASDNLGDQYNSNTGITTLVINLIGPNDGVVMAISDTPVQDMELKRAELQEILEDQTGLLVSIDHLVPSMVRYVECGSTIEQQMFQSQYSLSDMRITAAAKKTKPERMCTFMSLIQGLERSCLTWIQLCKGNSGSHIT